MSDLIKDIIDFNEEITKLSKCNSPEETLKFWTKDPSNDDLKAQLSILAHPDCPEPLLRYIFGISAEEDNRPEYINWLLQEVGKNPNTPDDLVDDLIKYNCYFVQETAASHPAFNVNNSPEKLESFNRYILKGCLVNPTTSDDIKNKIEELLKNTEKYPLHWMEISANVETEALEVHPNRFYNNIQSVGHLIHEQIFCDNEDYEDFDIEELQQCYFEDEDFFAENGVNDHASETYFFHPQKYIDKPTELTDEQEREVQNLKGEGEPDELIEDQLGIVLPNFYSIAAFFSISVYIPDYEGMSVNVANVKDVLRDLIKDFWSEDLSSLLNEHGEWLSLYNNIEHLFELLDSK